MIDLTYLMQDKLLTPKELSQIIHKSVSVLALARKDKRFPELPWIKIGGSVYYMGNNILKMINEKASVYL